MLVDAGMPEDWRLETLGNLAHYANGRAFKPGEWGDTGLPIIRIEQMNNPEAQCDYFDGVIAPDHVIGDGDLLFSWSATLTTLVWDRGPAALNQHIFKVVPRLGTDHDYLHHLLDYLIEGLAGQAHGSTMQHVKKSDLLPYPVHVSPLPEQRRIAKILDTADRAIGETEALISKLKRMKTGLMHDLLTRGLDERGQLRDPDAHPEQFKDSPLGQVPREWEILPMSSVALQSPGSTTIGPFGSNLVATDYRSSGVPVVFVRDIKAERFEWNSEVYVDSGKARQLFVHSVEPGDVVATKMGLPPCISCVYPEWMSHGIVTADVIRLRANRHLVNAQWLSHFINSDAVARQVRAITGGVTRPKVTLRDFRGLLTAVPSLTEQELTNEFLNAHDARIRAEEAYRDKLKLQKKGLMEDLLTGRVRVKMTQEVGA